MTENLKDNIAIKVDSIKKCYHIYDDPKKRLHQFISSLSYKLFNRAHKQYYSQFWALKDISFEVNRGESLGIIGRNGSGKSTLLQIIAGTVLPSEGSVNVNGRVAALLELGSGFNPEFTGRENILLNAAVLGLSTQEIEDRYEDIVSFADLGNFINQPLKTYSSGMAMRLAFSVIAHIDADILIIDEALSVGDIFFTQKCMRFLRDFMKDNTLIFVSHDSASIQSLCDKVIWLDNGSLIEMGNPKSITEKYLEASFSSKQGTSVLVEDSPKKKIETTELYDMRQDLFKSEGITNTLKIIDLFDETKYFGNLGAQIDHASLVNDNGQILSWCIGGEKVILQIQGHANQDINGLIAGFHVKNKLGQNLFGDNTYLTYANSPLFLEQRQDFIASFEFIMPRLPAGGYTVSLAVASGTQDDHIQHHWLHDAIGFESVESNVANGLIGIPMLNIYLHGA